MQLIFFVTCSGMPEWIVRYTGHFKWEEHFFQKSDLLLFHIFIDKKKRNCKQISYPTEIVIKYIHIDNHSKHWDWKKNYKWFRMRNTLNISVKFFETVIFTTYTKTYFTFFAIEKSFSRTILFLQRIASFTSKKIGMWSILSWMIFPSGFFWCFFFFNSGSLLLAFSLPLNFFISF